jgi:hypothetical protein
MEYHGAPRTRYAKKQPYEAMMQPYPARQAAVDVPTQAATMIICLTAWLFIADWISSLLLGKSAPFHILPIQALVHNDILKAAAHDPQWNRISQDMQAMIPAQRVSCQLSKERCTVSV